MTERQRDGGRKLLSFSRIAYSLPAPGFSLLPSPLPRPAAIREELIRRLHR